MNSYEIIKKKKNNLALSNREIIDFLNSFQINEVKDYQMSAFLMAVCFNGLSNSELSQFVRSIIDSGERLKFPEVDGPIVDKHSTGGIGDKVSIILAPLLASSGAYVPMIAGRGLGHTGGTIDKLESIPGYNTNLSIERFRGNVINIGASIISQTDSICPLDREIYKIRDVTATIDSFPLMASSILSKKIAEGIDNLVMDVKIGSGAFLKTESEAKEFSKIINKICSSFEIKSQCVITNMNQPLGESSGLANEVQECIDIMKGNISNDTKRLTLFLAEKCLEIAGIKKSSKDFEKLINSGHVFEKFEEMVYAHGGSINKFNKLRSPKFKKDFFLYEDGYIKSIDTYKIGIALNHLGCGRINFNSKLDYTAGITIHYKLGEKYLKKDPFFTLFSNNEEKLEHSKEKILESIQITTEKPIGEPLIYKVI